VVSNSFEGPSVEHSHPWTSSQQSEDTENLTSNATMSQGKMFIILDQVQRALKIATVTQATRGAERPSTERKSHVHVGRVRFK